MHSQGYVDGTISSVDEDAVTVLAGGSQVRVERSAKSTAPQDPVRPLLPRDPLPLPEDGVEDMDHLAQLHE